jgi:hypothetical protein
VAFVAVFLGSSIEAVARFSPGAILRLPFIDGERALSPVVKNRTAPEGYMRATIRQPTLTGFWEGDFRR